MIPWPALGRLVVVLALSFSLGPHWALLQTAAWAGMLLRYSHDGSFMEAAAKTFDGRHPCAVCKIVAEGSAKEKSQEQKQLKPGLKLEFGPVWQAAEFLFTCAHERVPALDLSGPSRSVQPPKPRPRGILTHSSARG